MAIDADAILKQCLDWEQSLAPALPTKVASTVPLEAGAPLAPTLRVTAADAGKQVAAELSALAGLLQPGQAKGMTAAKKSTRRMPAEAAISLATAESTGAAKPYDVDSSAAVLMAGKGLPASAAAASLRSGDARAVVVGRVGAGPSKSERSKAAKATAGRDWFDMPRVEVDAKMAADLQALRSRQWLNPKRFYKTKGEDRSLASRLEYFQAGTVVAGKLDQKTSSMTRRQRPSSLLQELTSDAKVDSFTRRTQRAVQEAASRAGGSGARRRAKRALSGGRAHPPKHTRTNRGPT
jgi:hypothetical protein